MSERDFRLYCADILDSGSAIFEFVKGLSFEQFCNDRKTYSAVIREFEIIGEAVGKLPEALKGRRPDVEWQACLTTPHCPVEFPLQAGQFNWGDPHARQCFASAASFRGP